MLVGEDKALEQNMKSLDGIGMGHRQNVKERREFCNGIKENLETMFHENEVQEFRGKV